jgi:hypothetical protein
MSKVRRIAKKYARKGNQSGGFYFKGGEYFEYRPYFDGVTIARSIFIKTNTERTTRRCNFIIFGYNILFTKLNYIYLGDHSTILSLSDMQKKVIHHPNISTFVKSVNFE